MTPVVEGGCLCGAVRYRMSGQPLARSLCHCRGVEGVTFAFDARKSFNIRAEILCGGDEQLVGGMLHQDFIAGIEERGHG